MTISEKVAYIKGLAENAGFDENESKDKVVKAIIDVLEDIAGAVGEINEQLDAVDEDLAALEDDYYEEYDEDEEENEPQGRRQSRHSNVIHDSRMDPRAAQEAQYTHCERIVNVRQIEECREIIKYLLRGESVLLNLENIDPKDCGRVVDLLSGAAFALQGRMLKVAHLSYLLAPENVEVIEEDVYAASRMRYR